MKSQRRKHVAIDGIAFRIYIKCKYVAQILSLAFEKGK